MKTLSPSELSPPKAGQACALASRPRRGRMSITAGVVSEANETCGPPECGMIVLEEGEHKGPVSRLVHSFHLWTCMASTHGLLMFALFLLWQATKSSARTDHLLTEKPQVAFASLSPPAVMDIRRLRRRLLEVFSQHARLRFSISLFSHPFSYPSSRRLMDLSNIFSKILLSSIIKLKLVKHYETNFTLIFLAALSDCLEQ